MEGGFAFLFGGGKACESLTAFQTSFQLDLSLRRVECRTIGCEFGFQNLSTGYSDIGFGIWNVYSFGLASSPGVFLGARYCVTTAARMAVRVVYGVAWCYCIQ